MRTMQSETSDFRFTGWHMLACMIVFFGVIIVVNFTMAIMASGTWTGLVVRNSYVASQEFNGELERAQQQADSGLRSKITHSDGEFFFLISDRNGRTIQPVEAAVWIGRPAFEQQDRTIEVICAGDGQCSATANLAPGAWAIRFEASLPEGTYRRDARLFVDAGGKVQVE